MDADNFFRMLDAVDEEMLDKMKNHTKEEISTLAWAIDVQYKESGRPLKDFLQFQKIDYVYFDVETLFEDYSLLEKKLERAKVFLTKGIFFSNPPDVNKKILEKMKELELPLQIEDGEVVYPEEESTPSPQ